MKEPTVMIWHGLCLVKISSLPRRSREKFKIWLAGQTLPYVEEDKDPTDWAYSWDYDRFKDGLAVID